MGYPSQNHRVITISISYELAIILSSPQLYKLVGGERISVYLRRQMASNNSRAKAPASRAPARRRVGVQDEVPVFLSKTYSMM